MPGFVGRAGAALALLLAAGAGYEQWGRAHWRETHALEGRLVDIGGRSVRLDCRGGGRHTVVFLNGLGGRGSGWDEVRSAISARTCVWDPPGAGWSDPGPLPRSAARNARDLHAALSAAGVVPPYVAVGASFGGFEARMFRAMWPGEVAGVVLVDASHEDEDRRIPVSLRAPVAPALLRQPLIALLQFAGVTGILRLTGDDHPASSVAAASIGIARESGDEVRAAGTLGDIPLIVLTAGRPFAGTPDARAYQEVWKHEMQPQLARLSTRGRQVIVEDASHGDIPPATIAKAITGILDTLDML